MPESTEREILKNFEEIVETSLPLKSYYEECAGSAKQVVLNYVTFFEQRKLVSTNMYIVAEEKWRQSSLVLVLLSQILKWLAKASPDYAWIKSMYF